MAYRFTDLALQLLEYKFYDINGDGVKDLRHLVDGHVDNLDCSNQKSYLFNNSTTIKLDNQTLEKGNTTPIDMDNIADSKKPITLDNECKNIGTGTGSTLTEIISAAPSNKTNDNPTSTHSVTFPQMFQEEYSKIKYQMSSREEKFIKRNKKFIKDKRIKPEYFFKQFYDSEKKNCFKDGQSLKHIFKLAESDLKEQPNFSKLFEDITIAKHAMEKILSKTNSKQN